MKPKSSREWPEYDDAKGPVPPDGDGIVGTHGPCVRNDGVRPTPYVNRKNIRAEFHDYSGGEYFVTVCTRDKCHYFGRIANGEMLFTPIGEYCRLQLEQAATHYP